jgi:hypothetical protein
VPRAGFEPTLLILERAKTFHALDSAATVIGDYFLWLTFSCPSLPDFRWTSMSEFAFFPENRFNTITAFISELIREKLDVLFVI